MKFWTHKASLEITSKLCVQTKPMLFSSNCNQNDQKNHSGYSFSTLIQYQMSSICIENNFFSSINFWFTLYGFNPSQFLTSYIKLCSLSSSVFIWSKDKKRAKTVIFPPPSAHGILKVPSHTRSPAFAPFVYENAGKSPVQTWSNLKEKFIYNYLVPAFGFNVFHRPNQICLGCNVFLAKMNEITSTLFIYGAQYLSYLSI